MMDEDALREEKAMYGNEPMTQQELNEKFPNRPHNHSKTLPFSDLYLTLFNPLQDNKKKPGVATANKRKTGPDAKSSSEIRRSIIERFISRWRKNVGNDIFPAIRLILPEKDRDRAMYGLKEMMIGKLLVKLMKIDKNSDDGYNILHWKLPGMKSSAAMAGDFAGRCFEVISKRPMLTVPGSMTIAEVNEKLDDLSRANKEEQQLPIFQHFYNNMNAEELMWLIRIILRQMKIGATEKTILDLWHPDAENLFNISSSLKRVCWELYDPQVRLEGDERGINLMQCFQPQLAAFQMRTLEQSVNKMKPVENDDTFWIEEKLDGERMQLHMQRNDDMPGGFRFKFWSRKAKDYTDLYGNGLKDTTGSLTKYMGDAFRPGVQGIILDGEMITWDMVQDKIYPFGHLKTAVISEQQTQYADSDGNRPLYRVFDCLYLNGKDLTNHTLRVRREALEKAVQSVHRRFEIHAYSEATDASEIEPMLREVVAEKSEGLVLKNPRSAYRLNDRNDDWIKVKPEYMTEFGEALDCVVIGGYYGSGNRGRGQLSSFLCGLRVDQAQIDQGQNPQRCFSFFKVGGGFTAADYAEIRHRTDGKWKDWDRNNPRNDLIVLGGGQLQYERPDVWILPEDSVVLEVKAASVHTTDQFGYGRTLRFPRFKKIRSDKTWQQALSMLEFGALRENVEGERKEKQFKVEDARKQRNIRKKKRSLIIQGQEDVNRSIKPYAAAPTRVFADMSFNIMTDALKPLKKSKAEIEAFVKVNGGKIVASDAGANTICIADRKLVKVASAVKRGEKSILRPKWLWDQVAQSVKDLEAGYALPGDDNVLRLPIEMDRHAFFATESDELEWIGNLDKFGDSYSRDLETAELEALFAGMPDDAGKASQARKLLDDMVGDGQEKLGRGLMFSGLTVWFAEGMEIEDASRRLFEFAGGNLLDGRAEAPNVTHVIVTKEHERLDEIRVLCTRLGKMPRIVTPEWIDACWKEGDRVDEEGYAP